MNWSSIGKSVGKFAPLLGTALGGPAGAAIGTLVSSALGVGNSPEDIQKAISSDPKARIKLKYLQQKHQEKLQEIALHTLSLELGDTANARENHKHSLMPSVITILLTIIVSGLLWAMFNGKIPEGNADLSMMMFGQVFALWGASITYWVGTTRSSAEKDRRVNSQILT